MALIDKNIYTQRILVLLKKQMQYWHDLFGLVWFQQFKKPTYKMFMQQPKEM